MTERSRRVEEPNHRHRRLLRAPRAATRPPCRDELAAVHAIASLAHYGVGKGAPLGLSAWAKSRRRYSPSKTGVNAHAAATMRQAILPTLRRLTRSPRRPRPAASEAPSARASSRS